MSDQRSAEAAAGVGTAPAKSWTWPHPTLPNRWNATVTEVHDLAADGRRVAVSEGAIWPDVGSRISVHEDEEHVRRGTDWRISVTSFGPVDPEGVDYELELAFPE